jgi:uncharacterized membrane protein
MRRIITRLSLLLMALSGAVPAFPCTLCNKETIDAIYDDSFLPNLGIMLSAFIVLAIIVAILAAAGARRYKGDALKHPGRTSLSPVPLTSAATVLGIGLGGFIDGIALHQILQWHEMLSFRMPPTTVLAKTVNMFWDGVFHAFCLIVVVIGVIMLWKLLRRQDIDRSGNLLGGGFLLGWGLFNIVEGVIDHHLLKLHNVKEISSNPEAWNWGFLGLSVVMLIAGYAITRKSKNAERHAPESAQV